MLTYFLYSFGLVWFRCRFRAASIRWTRGCHVWGTHSSHLEWGINANEEFNALSFTTPIKRWTATPAPAAATKTLHILSSGRFAQQRGFQVPATALLLVTSVQGADEALAIGGDRSGPGKRPASAVRRHKSGEDGQTVSGDNGPCPQRSFLQVSTME